MLSFSKVMPKVRRPEKNNHLSDKCLINIGQHYLIKRKNNDWTKGEVLLRRLNKSRKFIEYYIHFNGLDKRMDEWVPLNRFCLPSLELYQADSCISFDEHNQIKSKNLKSVSVVSCVNDGRSFLSLSDSGDAAEQEHKELTRIKYINTIQLGLYEIDTWYYSPYPDEYGEQEKLYICEFCLKYMHLETTYCYHLGSCKWKGPPGDIIYKKASLVIYEVDPTYDQLYCQNLSLLAKLFIDHKTIFYDVEQFLFYVLCEVDASGAHIKGYFCKEKESHDENNVSCILTLPPFQRLGFGKLLIGFSYELSKLEGATGSPEKPLSDLGILSYESYWAWVLLKNLDELRGETTISSLCQMTGIAASDIISTLKSMNLLKFWAGTDIVCLPPDLIRSAVCSGVYRTPRLTVDPNALNWIPYSSKKRRIELDLLQNLH